MKFLALVLVLLAGRSAVADGGNDESDPFLGQLNSIEFLPLEVGNRWTYTHVYRNETYFEDAPGVFPDIDPADLKQFEVPGYPFGRKTSVPPESLLLPDGKRACHRDHAYRKQSRGSNISFSVNRTMNGPRCRMVFCLDKRCA